MELRHLRYFVALAEELSYTRAAERLNMETSPLSRAIKELEQDMGAQLFERDTRGARLTWPGQVMLQNARRVFTVLDQMRITVQAAASGFRGTLRIALSDGIVPARLAELFARCREQEPEVDLRLFEVSLTQQIEGIQQDLYDVGLARFNGVDETMISEPVWDDRLMVAVPARHPLLIYKFLPLEKVLEYPLILCDQEACPGTYCQMERMLRHVDAKPSVAEYVATPDLMLALVSAGFGIGFASEARLRACSSANVVIRPLAGAPSMLTTYLLRRSTEPSPELERFINRVRSLERVVETI